MIIFYALHYTRGFGFDHQVFEPSFPSFLLPFHPGLRYVPRLKTTLRLWDQTLSLTVFTWTGFCRLVEVKSLLCFLLWEILLEALGFSLLLGISMFDGFFWVWRQSIDDIRFVILLCIKCPNWGIFYLYSEILSHGWGVWLSLIFLIEMFDWC